MNKYDNKPLELAYRSNGRFDIRIFGKDILGTRLTARIGKKEAELIQFEEVTDLKEDDSCKSWRLLYVSPSDKSKTFAGIIKVYSDHCIFETINHFEVKGKKRYFHHDVPYISFPCFEGEKWESNCSCLSFKPRMPFNYPVQWQGSAVDSFRDGRHIPLLITNDTYETVILSPINQLLHSIVSTDSTSNSIKCGIPRSVKRIEAKTRSMTVMVYGIGVNKTLGRWGEILRRHHGIKPIACQADVSLSYISYWTNAGSAYWYKVHKKSNYEETLKLLKAHHEKNGLKFGSYQLDSWWYRKEGDAYTSGITEWVPKQMTRSKNFNAMLPFLQRYKNLKLFEEHCIGYVQKILDKPLGCHFKQLANDTVYMIDEEGNYLVEEFPIPKDGVTAERLFRRMFDRRDWRLSYIIHDWLQYMNDRHSGFRDMSVATSYFEALDKVCMDLPAVDNKCRHLSLQLCMTQPHMTLNSVSMQSVTSIRSTSDAYSFFVEGTKRWWWHLYSSAFIQALGKYAYYDNRRTNKRYYYPYASYPKFELIWLALSCGPIGIGDELGKENFQLLQRVVKEDGEIIKPDVPAVPLDRCYLYNPHTFQSDKGVAVYSRTDLKETDNEGLYRVFYLLVFNVHPFGRKVHMSYTLEEIGADMKVSYAVYDYFTEKIVVLAASDINNHSMSRRKFLYQIVAPVRMGLAIFGDVSKHVSCSNQIIKGIQLGLSTVVISLRYVNFRHGSTYVLYSERSPSDVTLNGNSLTYFWKSGKLVIMIPPVRGYGEGNQQDGTDHQLKVTLV